MEKQAAEHIVKVMTYRIIPPGQMRLFKALFDAGQKGLSFSELPYTSDCTVRETKSTLGALGKRVTSALGKVYSKPSRLLVDRTENGQYVLSEGLVEFINATSSFEEALRISKMPMFYLHTPTAWHFVWNADKATGSLREFKRGRKRAKT